MAGWLIIKHSAFPHVAPSDLRTLNAEQAGAFARRCVGAGDGPDGRIAVS